MDWPTLRISMVIIVARRPGSVTCQMRRSRPAPSMAAASYNSLLMPPSEAINTIEAQPASFQQAEKKIKERKVAGVVRKFTPFRPRHRRR